MVWCIENIFRKSSVRHLRVIFVKGKRKWLVRQGGFGCLCVIHHFSKVEMMRAKGPAPSSINLHNPHTHTVCHIWSQNSPFRSSWWKHPLIIIIIIAAGVPGHNSVYTAKVIFHNPALLFPVWLKYERILFNVRSNSSFECQLGTRREVLKESLNGFSMIEGPCFPLPYMHSLYLFSQKVIKIQSNKQDFLSKWLSYFHISNRNISMTFPNITAVS